MTDEQRKQAPFEQRDWLRVTLSTITDFAYVFDHEGRFLFVNQPLLDLWGRTLEEAVGKNFFDLQYPDELAEKLQRQIHEVFETKRRLKDETPYVSPTGKGGYYEYIFTPVFAEDGSVEAVAGSTRDITERKQAQNQAARLLRELNAERERLTDVFQRAPSFMCVLRGPEHVFERANELYKELVGHREILGKPVREALPEVEGQGYFELLDRVYQTGEAFTGTQRVILQRRPGHPPEERHVDFVYQALREADGSISGVFVQGVDLTERKRAEEALGKVLAESEQRKRLYEAVMRSTPDLVYVFDRDYRFIYANDALLRMWGRTWEESVGKRLLEIGYEPWHAEMHEREIDEVIATKQAVRGEVPFTGTQGRRIYDYIFVPVLNEEGIVEAVAGTTRDVTERKRMEEANARLHQELRLRLEEMETILRTAPIGIGVAHDREARVITGNPAFHRLLEVEPGDNASKTGPESDTLPFRVFSEDGSEVPSEDLPMQQAARDGIEVRDVPLIVRFRGGRERHVMLTAVPLFDEEGRSRGSVAAFVDVTELRAIAAELQGANRRKDEFLAMLSHELRNPLAPIVSALHLLHSDDDEAVRQEALDVLDRQVNTLARLVDDLLDVARVTSGKIQLQSADVDLNSVAQHTADSFRALMAERQHQFTVALSSTPLLVHGDVTRLEQVMVNLLSNAAKYTPEGGHVALTVGHEEEAGEAVIRVKDSGMGIDTGLLKHVFELFAQDERSLDRRQGGLGLGLALVKSLVEMHGGTVTAASEGPGQGSEFVVRLPVVPSPALETEPPATDIPQPLSPLRVLLVDDNVDMARIFARLLKRFGHETRTTHSGPEALEAAKEYRPDVVLLDIGLPEMDGYEVAKRMRQEPALQRVVLVAMTGYGMETDRLRSREAGFDNHLVKPAEMDELKRILAEVAQSKQS